MVSEAMGSAVGTFIGMVLAAGGLFAVLPVAYALSGDPVPAAKEKVAFGVAMMMISVVALALVVGK